MGDFAMSIVAPKGRKHLAADALCRLMRSGVAHIPDHRSGDPAISLPDALMSAFAMFSLKSPSLLAFDEERTEGNLQTIYGIERAPCDTHMRESLDPTSPNCSKTTGAPLEMERSHLIKRGSSYSSLRNNRFHVVLRGNPHES